MPKVVFTKDKDVKIFKFQNDIVGRQRLWTTVEAHEKDGWKWKITAGSILE